MARYGTLKRNLRRNIRPWSEDDQAKRREGRAAFAKVVAVFLALALSGAFVPLAANLVFRIPDLYSFDLGRTLSTAEIGMNVSDGTIASAISSFMRHKTDGFQVEAEADGQKSLLFTEGDRAAMTALRAFLDNMLVIGLTSLILFAALSTILVRWNRPRELRRGFVGGFALYGALICFTALVIVLGGPARRICADIVGVRFAPGDMMPKLFHEGLFLSAWIAVTVVTLVIMVILLSVMRRLTRHESMFLGKSPE